MGQQGQADYPERPALRIGHAERDAVIADLQTHTAAGRLDLDELGERIGQVYEARTAPELAAIMADLPSLRPQPPVPQAPTAVPPNPYGWGPRPGWQAGPHGWQPAGAGGPWGASGPGPGRGPWGVTPGSPAPWAPSPSVWPSPPFGGSPSANGRPYPAPPGVGRSSRSGRSVVLALIAILFLMRLPILLVAGAAGGAVLGPVVIVVLIALALMSRSRHHHRHPHRGPRP
jgi:hypothetical protein